MKNKSYLFIIVMGVVAGAVMNMEAIVLNGYDTIYEQYMSAVFPFNAFLEYKQYFVSFKLVFISLIFLCLTVNMMKKYQLPYALLRVKNKYCWELKLTLEIVKPALLFYLGITLTVFIMSICICGKPISIFEWKTWFLSWIALAYLGIILGCAVNLLVGVTKAKTAVMITYILFLLGTYGTMHFSDFFMSSKILLYLNPITGISIVEEKQVGTIVFALLGMNMISFVCQNVVAYGYVRWEKYHGNEN